MSTPPPVQVGDLEIDDAWSDEDRSIHFRSAYPLYWGNGARSTSVVYLEIDPGHRLGVHTHSAEETVVILEGTVEVVVDGRSAGRLEAGGLATVPALTPHDVRNAGDGTARFVGVFTAAAVYTEFEQPLQPAGERASGTPSPG